MRRMLLAAWYIGLCACRQATPATAPVVASPATSQAEAPEQPVAADSLARARLADLSVVVPGALFDLRYATSNNFTGAVLPGYAAAHPLLRREAAVALGRAEALLERQGYRLKVWDGYRPVRATLGMVAWCQKNHRIDLLNDGYIARHSRHNQGVAIDLTVVDMRTGSELDMGTPFDNFTEHAHTANATGMQAMNRKILGDAMRRAGFVNYANEWWHFSYDVPDAVPFDLPLEAWR